MNKKIINKLTRTLENLEIEDITIYPEGDSPVQLSWVRNVRNDPFYERISKSLKNLSFVQIAESCDNDGIFLNGEITFEILRLQYAIQDNRTPLSTEELTYREYINLGKPRKINIERVILPFE